MVNEQHLGGFNLTVDPMFLYDESFPLDFERDKDKWTEDTVAILGNDIEAAD
ncbi:MAG: hypothetical protein AAFQ76_08275 [Cyanobacteria bacterium J06626_26]